MQHDWSEGRTKEKEGLKKKKGSEKMNVKKIKEGVASVKTKEEKPPVKTKKYLGFSPGNKVHKYYFGVRTLSGLRM
jgi:hypothetical protein